MRTKVKTWLCMGLAVSMTLGSGFAAYAGAWVKGEGENQDRWRYDHQDGTFANSGWFWIDGNGDGVAESYCFDGEGWLYVNTTTPDGYEVNENGAWVSEGQVMTQTQNAEVPVLDLPVAGTYYFYAYEDLQTGSTQTELVKTTMGGNEVNMYYPSSTTITVVDENTIHVNFSQDEAFPKPDTYVLKKDGDGFVLPYQDNLENYRIRLHLTDLHFYDGFIKIGAIGPNDTNAIVSYKIYKR